MLASDRVLQAALVTIHRGLVQIRNQTLSSSCNIACINSLAEALHAIPEMIQGIQYFSGDEERLTREIRIHLECFDHTKCPDSHNLVSIFEQELHRHDA